MVIHDVSTDLHAPRWLPAGKVSKKVTKTKIVAVIFIVLLLTLGISIPLGDVSYDAIDHDHHIRHQLSIDTTPSQVHLSMGDSPRTLVVMWSTLNYADSTIFYGTEKENLATVAKGQTKKLTALFDQGRPHIHRVELNNLKLNTVYYYCVQSHGMRSRIFQFKTWPSEKPDWSPKFLVYGDMLAKSDIMPHVARDISSGQYHGIIHMGDFAYDLSSKGGSVGDEFMEKISQFAGNISYFTCPGDHENNAEFLHYRYRFSMPFTPWPMPLNKLWYSFDAGYAHIISISTVAFDEKKRYLYKYSMYQWLVKDLAAANMNRAHRPWVIVIGHEPMYCSNFDCYPNSLVKKDLEDLFFKQGVDLYISGHEHSYERSWPVFNGQVWGKSYTNPGATVQLVLGTPAIPYSVDKFISTKPGWSALRTNKHGESYGRLQVINITHLHWEVYSPSTEKIIDEFTLIQTRHGSFKIFGNLSNAEVTRSDLPFLMPMFYEVSAGVSDRNYLFLLGCILFVTVVLVLRKRFPFLTKRLMFSLSSSKRVGKKTHGHMSNPC